MKVKAVDIKHSVFDNETEATMYVIRDPYEYDTKYIFSIPVYTFSWDVMSERDYDDLLNYNLWTIERRENLIKVMKDIINSFEEEL